MEKSYEVHITISPVFGEDLEAVKEIVEPHGFKVAELLIQKDREDTPERSDKDTFCTGHFGDSHEATYCMLKATNDLRSNGFDVWRNKVEHIIYDERFT